MTYEFVRGARVSPTEVLDSCETSITTYMLDFGAAQDYIQIGKLLGDKDVVREGWFRIYDTQLLLTELTRGCWDSYWRTGESMNTLVANNVLSEKQTLINLMFEYYELGNNVTVFFADFFFSDWLSFAYYAGDTIYRLMVVQHKLNLDLN